MQIASSHNPAESILVGVSPALVELRATIARFGPTKLPVLIEGPTGSGKELVASALHQASGRPGAHVAFNLCAVSESMFEDALFGHVKGAFTGAVTDRAGFLSEATGGTVFLDEIAGLDLGCQAKLLRAIETGTFRPVGASRDRMSDFRVIAASNESLTDQARQGRFRKDLLHRLAGVVLRVPSLADRPEDIVPLSRHFLARLERSLALSSAAECALVRHAWPGNVRELKLTIERASILSVGNTIETDVVRAAIHSQPDCVDAPVPRDIAERNDLVELLEAVGWDTMRAAEHLGVHRATVYRRMRQWGIAAGYSSSNLRDQVISALGAARAHVGVGR